MMAPYQEALLVVWGINVMTAPHQESLLVVWGINVMTAPHQEGLLVLRGINVMMAPHPNCPRAVIAWGPTASGPPCNCSHYS